MAKLDIGVGQEFPLEEKSGGERCGRSRRGQHHHHYGFWRDYFRRRFQRKADSSRETPKTENTTNDHTGKE